MNVPFTCKPQYISLTSFRYPHNSIFIRAILFFFISFLLYSPILSAQEDVPEETTVFLLVRNVGGTELPAYIKGEILYLPVPDLFTFLKIQNNIDPDIDSVTGLFIHQQAYFIVDYPHQRIVFLDKEYNLAHGDLIKTENNLYLRSNFFGEIFGLDCAFNFRSLSVFLTSKTELPVIRQMKQELMRANINKLKGDMKTDTVIRRTYPFFSFGAADWSFSSTEVVQGPVMYRANLNIGLLFAGGDATIGLNFGNAEPFMASRQFWQWHFANNDFRILKQIYIGKIAPHAISSMSSSVIGASVTNTPTTFRRSFGTYIITDYTQPGWIVELYVNYVLVDYTKADASGYFSFEVPLVYGNSNVKLRFYGPWGEEHTREQTIIIPFNFLPVRKFEYMVSGGVLENKQHSVFSKANLFFGASRRLTIGGGVEYLSSVYKDTPMPFLNMSMRIGSGLIVSAEYMHFVRFRGVMSWRLPYSLFLEGYYTRYDPNQKAVFNSFLEERKVIVTKPIRFPSFGVITRLTLDQVILERSRSFSSELLISGSYHGISTNLTTYALFSDPVRPYIYSDLSLSFRLPAKFIVTPQVQYVFTMNQLLFFKLKIEKQIWRNGVINLSYDKNFLARMDNFQVGFRYDFPFAQANVSARYGEYRPSFIQYARGSVINKGKEGGLGFSNFSSVGKGGITLIAFLDLNGNGRWDKKDEPKVPGLTLHINGGRIERNTHDSTIRISDLEPYNKYFIELDRDNFENISWRLPKATIGITINPNQYTLIEVPVVVMGEVSGYVYLRKDSIQKGQGRIYIRIYKNDSSLVSRTLSETDGYFSYFGLVPGSYFARIDTSQLNNIRMTCSPETIPFTISRTREGDFEGGLEFFLRSTKSDTLVPVREEAPQKQAADTINTVAETKKQPPVADIPQEKSTPLKPAVIKAVPQKPATETRNLPDTGSCSIQVGAFRSVGNARLMQKKMSVFPEHPAVIEFQNGFYKVRITGFRTRDEAAAFMKDFVKKEVAGAFIYKNR